MRTSVPLDTDAAERKIALSMKGANRAKEMADAQGYASPNAGGATLGDRVADETSVTPDRGAESLRLRGLLAAAIARLPEEQREVFVMREYAGMPFKEIADVVGVPENTVKSRMRYALEHLRAHLAQHGVVPETT